MRGGKVMVAAARRRLVMVATKSTPAAVDFVDCAVRILNV
jgi:hypothetical protein